VIPPSQAGATRRRSPLLGAHRGEARLHLCQERRPADRTTSPARTRSQGTVAVLRIVMTSEGELDVGRDEVAVVLQVVAVGPEEARVAEVELRHLRGS